MLNTMVYQKDVITLMVDDLAAKFFQADFSVQMSLSDNHGGVIQVESEVGQASPLFFNLPIELAFLTPVLK